ncbi:MAG: SDR family oxidoreductase [Proteobacteria bacterium]|nr:SDR family oxidoreductase [Pseudomonadota bacterium]MBI3498556.1 SDR family oxidoreductase [Pseudomonadota bacterium]
MLFDMQGKVAVVTGSSRGIGRAIAHAMARAGASVVISSRKLEPCQGVAAEIAAFGGKAIAIACNVGRKPELEALVAGARKAYGRIDVMVANAAVNPHFGPLLAITDEAFDKIMATNVKSNLWLAQLVLPEMAERKDGSMIIVSSIAGLRGATTLGAYAISKAADFQLARSLAVEWGPSNVRVNCIAPGLVKTDFARALWEDPVLYEKAVLGSPLRRIGEPDDIAGAAVFLASRAGAFMTGQVIIVDGGATMIAWG